MMMTRRNNRALLAGTLLSLLINVPAIADDTEVYVGGNTAATSVPPNVLFVVDTSFSMFSVVTTQVPYDPATDYSGLPTSCASFSSNRIYWATGTVDTSCTNSQWFDIAYLKCDAAANTASTMLNSTGFYQDRLQRYSDDQWQDLATDTTGRQRNVECQSDFSRHGIDGPSSALWPAENSGDNATGGWTSNSNSADIISWPAQTNYTLYTANRMNYLRADPTVNRTRLEVVQDVVSDVVDSVNGINIGLMRFSNDQEGGYVAHAMEDISTGRAGFKAALNGFTPDGATPLSEALWEAMQYYRGDAVDYGNTSAPGQSVGGSREAANFNLYDSPIQHECQRNSIILLSDGAPNGDNGRDPQIQGMTNFAAVTGAANCPHPSSHVSMDGDADDGQCLDQVADYMAGADQLPSGMNDDQFVQTYTIGFELDHQLLRSTALLGDGLYYTADDTTGLTNAFTSIINEVLASNATFTSPGVSVNAFSRTTHRNELYFTLFRPGAGPHWDGNLKKYRLGFVTDANGDRIPQIQDGTGASAVDPTTGFFRNTAQSFWSNNADGDEVSQGGAAHELSTTRNVYTYMGFGMPSNESLVLSGNALHEANGSITEAALGMAPGATSPSRDELLQWARGLDVDRNYGSPAPPAPPLARPQVGDPLHSQATVVQYGGTEANPDLTVFYSTNDGYLHAVQESDGSELFSFVPREMLSNLLPLYRNVASPTRAYGLDGSIVTWTRDVNADGIITPATDHVFVYVGMRRGGNNYYALDVSNRSVPVLKWMITNDTDKDGTPDGDFAELGQSWSDPVVKRINWNGSERIVLIFGGGYDSLQDGNNLPADDNVGRAVYVVDATTGARLWWAGPTGSGANLELTNLTNAVPAKIAAVDVSGNGIVDRLYFGDTRAQLWRVDVNEGNNGATDFATGGRIAALAGTADTSNRRFYHALDAALIAPQGQLPYVALVTGSGYRAHPLNMTIRDRIYMIKDLDVFSTPTSYTTVTEADLFDATSNVIGEGTTAQRVAANSALSAANGWFIQLSDPTTNAWLGEKVLAQPLIADNVAVIPSFIPNDPTAGPLDCGPNDGTGLLYYLNIHDATPVVNLDDVGGDIQLTRSDRTHQLIRGGITPSPSLLIADDGAGGITPVLCTGTECDTPPIANLPVKTYWFEF